MAASGIVYLVGAGPGDPGLLTCRGAELLARADVVVYDGLASPVLLGLARPQCERVYAGKKHAPAGEPPLTQEQIHQVLVDRARAGKTVVRLKGGDPFVFGRGAEECQALRAAGVTYQVVPGVSSATAVPAYAGIPLTARGVASTAALSTGHEADGKPQTIDWSALAGADTVVLFMALATARDCCRRLIEAGRDPSTPAAAIRWGTTASQETVVAPLGQLADAIRETGLKPPALLVVGQVVALRPQLDWYARRPMHGMRVVVTRSAEQAEGFARALGELGAEVLAAPLTRVVPPAAADQAGLARALDRLARGGFGWIILTSANAARRLFEELGARGLDARALAGARVACVGAATARALAGFGVRADLVPAHGNAAGVARAVIDAAGGSLAGTQVLVPRAAEGREEAAQLLAAAGAVVEVATVYRLEPVAAEEPEVAEALKRLRARQVHALALFAPSQVRALFDLLGETAGAVLGDVPMRAAVGATTARALTERGLSVQVVPSRPDAEVLAAEMAAAASSHSPP